MVKGSEVMQIVFSMKIRVEIMAIHYCMLELVFFKVLSHVDPVHVAEDASESAFIRYPGADEIVTGSPENSTHMHIMHVTKSDDDLWILAALTVHCTGEVELRER